MVPQSTPSPPLTTTFQPISIPTASGIPAGLGQALSPGSVPTSGNTGSVNGGVMGNAARPQSRSPSSRSTPPPSPPLSVTAEVRLPKKVLPSTIANGIQHASDEEERIQSPSMVTQEETGSVGDSQNIRGTVQFRHRKSSTSPQSGPSGGSDTAAEAKDGSTVYTSQELDIAYSMVISTQPQGKSRSQRQRQVHDTRSFQASSMEVNLPEDYPSSGTRAAHVTRHADTEACPAQTGHIRGRTLDHSYQQEPQHHVQERLQPYSAQDSRLPSSLDHLDKTHSCRTDQAPPTQQRNRTHEHHSTVHTQPSDHVYEDGVHDSHARQTGQEGRMLEQGRASAVGGGGNSSAGRVNQHPGTRSAPYTFHPPGHSSSTSSYTARVSHHPNAINRYPFSIPSISAKLDEPAPEDGDDALSSLWKRTTPLQEPYFRTRHTIASQHTLSTLGGVLFSLDEVPQEFTQDMYIAMRNRIFELEAKTTDYSPFSSRKRSFERSGLDDYSDRYDYDIEPGHYSKRPSYGHPPYPHSRYYGPPEGAHPPSPVHRYSTSYPSWYTPEVYMNGMHYPPYYGRHPAERERDHRLANNSYDDGLRSESRPMSRPGSPPSNIQAHSPPPPGPSTKPPGPPGNTPSLVRSQGPTQEARSPHQHDERDQSTHGVPRSHLQVDHPSLEQPPHRPSNSHGQQPPSHHQPDTQHSSHTSHYQKPHGYPPLTRQQQQHPTSTQATGPSAGIPTQGATTEIRHSIHQQKHRAQQQAQSAHSRSYHLQKHMRMLDEQRVAQLSGPQQQQEPPQQQQEPKQQTRPIQRQYQPHQQMYPAHGQPVPIKPYPQQTAVSQLKQQQAHTLRHHPYAQQQILQRYYQQRQLLQKQQQLRQLQYMRSRQSASYPTQKNPHITPATTGPHSTTPPRLFGSQLDQPIKKATRPPECSNCMALDSLTSKPRTELQSEDQNGSLEILTKMLCSACSQYLQTHGKPRPVPPFRTNFLKKIHTRFKRELQEVRFQGWQDAQVLEIEDRMSEREFQMVFNGLDDNDTSRTQARQSLSPPAIVTVQVADDTTSEVGMIGVTKEKANDISTLETSSTSKSPEAIVIKIEDDDITPPARSKPESAEVRTYQSEASMGELFGHRWRTEPVVGYTLVHFGGSDRTRMVPMNPTVPSLTVTFNRSEETITFAFRVLVNGLCLLSSGGGPPALHMPEMADDDDSEEEEEEIVVVPDNDKDDPSPSPPTATTAPSTEAKSDGDTTIPAATATEPTSSGVSNVSAGVPASQDQ